MATLKRILVLLLAISVSLQGLAAFLLPAQEKIIITKTSPIIPASTTNVRSLTRRPQHHNNSAKQAILSTVLIPTNPSPSPQLWLSRYKQLLKLYPLPTQIMTGVLLAILGDALAQQRQRQQQRQKQQQQENNQLTKQSNYYDLKRAISFALFDIAYRILQHYAFPFIVLHCHGRLMRYILFPITTNRFVAATLEQTLANQFIIVPFLYYPAFFIMTGYVQGLNIIQTIQRAKNTFWFLMKRNLLFWIPIQFIQFGFIEESLQIPFVCLAGLIWTTILSLLAGSATSSTTTTTTSTKSNNNYNVQVARAKKVDIESSDII